MLRAQAFLLYGEWSLGLVVFISFRADAERGESSRLQSSRRRARVRVVPPKQRAWRTMWSCKGGGVVSVRHVDEDGCSLHRGFRDRKPTRTSPASGKRSRGQSGPARRGDRGAGRWTLGLELRDRSRVEKMWAANFPIPRRPLQLLPRRRK